MTTTRLQVPIDALPGDVRPHEYDAGLRWLRGEKLGQHAAKSARTFRRKVERWRRSGGTFDFARDGRAPDASPAGNRPGQAPAAIPARPGAGAPASPSPTSRPPGDRTGTPVAGGAALPRSSGVDAMRMSGAEFNRYLASRGIDSSWHQIDRCVEDERRTREAPSTSVVVAQRSRAAGAAQRQAERARQLEAGRLDARGADRDKVVSRLAQLGQTDPDLLASIRTAGKPMPPPTQVDHSAVVAAAQRRAAAEAKRLARGEKVDARSMDRSTLAAYAARRGFSWPG